MVFAGEIGKHVAY